jgi:hypothetical protein
LVRRPPETPRWMRALVSIICGLPCIYTTREITPWILIGKSSEKQYQKKIWVWFRTICTHYWRRVNVWHCIDSINTFWRTKKTVAQHVDWLSLNWFRESAILFNKWECREVKKSQLIEFYIHTFDILNRIECVCVCVCVRERIMWTSLSDIMLLLRDDSGSFCLIKSKLRTLMRATSIWENETNWRSAVCQRADRMPVLSSSTNKSNRTSICIICIVWNQINGCVKREPRGEIVVVSCSSFDSFIFVSIPLCNSFLLSFFVEKRNKKGLPCNQFVTEEPIQCRGSHFRDGEML